MDVKAKFRCMKVERNAYGPMRYTFSPQYEPDVPEDKRYALTTPSGELWMNVDNPDVTFEVGGYYYLTLTPIVS